VGYDRKGSPSANFAVVLHLKGCKDKI
jgi:hypothetical protein